MNKCFTIAVVVCCIACLIQPTNSRAESPALVWEQHSEGVAVALVLEDRHVNGIERAKLKIHIKNTSSAIKYLPNPFSRFSIRISYIANGSSETPLLDYSLQVPPAFSAVPVQKELWPYKPNEEKVKTIELSAEEVAKVKQFPILCRFHIADQDASGFTSIVTKPVSLGSRP